MYISYISCIVWLFVRHIGTEIWFWFLFSFCHSLVCSRRKRSQRQDAENLRMSCSSCWSPVVKDGLTSWGQIFLVVSRDTETWFFWEMPVFLWHCGRNWVSRKSILNYQYSTFTHLYFFSFSNFPLSVWIIKSFISEYFILLSINP